MTGAPMKIFDFDEDDKASPCKDDASCSVALLVANAILHTHTHAQRITHDTAEIWVGTILRTWAKQSEFRRDSPMIAQKKAQSHP